MIFEASEPLLVATCIIDFCTDNVKVEVTQCHCTDKVKVVVTHCHCADKVKIEVTH